MTKKAQGDLLKFLTVETTGEKVLSFIQDEYHDNFDAWMPKHDQPVSFKKGCITKEELKERTKLFSANY